MTDMITVSRKEIEVLQKNFTKDGLSGNGDYIAVSDLRDLLDKAEVSEPIGEMKENGVTWFKQNPHAYTVGTKFYTTPQPSRISELEAEIAKLTAIIEDMKVVDNVFGVGDKKDGESGTKYCCIESWKKAKDEAWSKRNFKLCKCDHCESCEHCYPPEFYTGGKWDLCKPREAEAKVKG